MPPMKRKPGPRPTLGDLHRATPWLWLYCEKCQHHAPLACAVPVIRWGADASSDVLRRRARCTACGHKGARHHANLVSRLEFWVVLSLNLSIYGLFSSAPYNRLEAYQQSNEGIDEQQWRRNSYVSSHSG